MKKANKQDIVSNLLDIDRLDFSVGDIVTVTEGEYAQTGLKLMEIKEDGTCILRVSPDNEVTIEIYFDKVKSLASYEELFAKSVNKPVMGVLGGRNLH